MDLFEHDETLARHRDVGVLTHHVIGTLAAHTLQPSVELVTAEVAAALPRFGPIEGRAHKQNAVGHVLMFFRWLLPPAPWVFHGTEVWLGVTSRVDVLWQHATQGWLLLDEIKTGQAGWLECTPNRLQAHRYLQVGEQMYGSRLVGLRLLSTQNPGASRLYTPDGGNLPLPSTPYVSRRTS